MLSLLAFLACHHDKDEGPSGDTFGETGETWESDWSAPACDGSGASAVTWTADAGSSAAATQEALDPDSHTRGLVTLSTAGGLAAVHEGLLLRSSDAGCTWSELSLPDRVDRALLAAPGDVLYAWASSADTILRIDGDTVSSLTAPAQRVVGLAADGADHLRAGDDGCNIYESSDGGQSWTVYQAAPSKSLDVAAVAFDPDDLEHVVCALTHDGAFVSTNGGERWDRARGFETKDDVNFFAALITPGDRDIVWAEGLRMEDTKRLVWRSIDGGLTWKYGLEEGDGVTLDNGVPLAVHPAQPNVLAFSSGENLYLYDAHTDALTISTPMPGYDVEAIAPSLAQPGIWYLGLGDEEY